MARRNLLNDEFPIESEVDDQRMVRVKMCYADRLRLSEVMGYLRRTGIANATPDISSTLRWCVIAMYEYLANQGLVRRVNINANPICLEPWPEGLGRNQERQSNGSENDLDMLSN